MSNDSENYQLALHYQDEGKYKEAIASFHQLTDLAETDIKNQGKPFVDTSPGGVKLIGIDTPWEYQTRDFMPETDDYIAKMKFCCL